jgi:hypothetical protein
MESIYMKNGDIVKTIIYIFFTSLLTASASPQQGTKTVHVFVALCDNEHQGIVPVPEKLGDGDDPANNLYWGALYGTKTFLKKTKDWTVVATNKKPSDEVLERIVFRHTKTRTYLVADAYRGRKIEKAVEDFLNAAAGNNAGTLKLESVQIKIHGAADLLVYVGHNGLMDFPLKTPERNKDSIQKNAIVLACKSRPYFQPILKKIKCKSVLLTTGFMAPEAYSLEAALAGWIAKEKPQSIRERAARAYHKYQKCGLKAARSLFYSEH